ncbi:hypothetical protein [Candidatus Uabimicrobium amorphum]|uniref:Uncharacterized protein n=1 Tax=Uabimicrobium amorphum TaxID=2596890 RepID=A0A5S9IUY5_UABAM|nr:hypothetical protein [Candidatus Uabimicrobium amorphum]BBM88066.1 hypothetical protein UABAM_06482 [Candidatus Uabimicrobium amorphum]
MNKYIVLFILMSVVFCDTTTYDALANNAADYKKKTVTFSFRYKGLRAHISPAIINHGISEKKYIQLQANDLKLALLAHKNSSVDKKLRKTDRNTSLMFLGKVKYWNARWGDKFYYVLISSVREVSEDEQKNTSTSEKNTNDEPNRNKATKNPTLKELGQRPQDFAGQKIELSILFLKTAQFNKDYQRIWTLSRLPIVYNKKQKNIVNILNDVQEKHPIKVSGKIRQMQIRNRQVYVLELDRVKASIKEIPRERFIRNRFRRRRN